MNTSVEDFIADFLSNELYARMPATYKHIFEQYPPWNFYTYNDNPARVYRIIDKGLDIYLLKVLVLDAVDGSITDGEVLPGNIMSVSSWTSEQLTIIEELPTEAQEVFCNKLGYVAIV